MPLTLELPDPDLITEEQVARLRLVLGADDDDALRDALERVARASLDEYKEMLLGLGLPSRADEIQQHRLFFLIKRYFNGRLPTEAEVSAMFQLTQPRSRSLIRYVMTRYRFELEDEVLNSLAQTLRDAQENQELHQYEVEIQSDNVVEELNRIVGRRAPKSDRITKVRNTSRTFAITEDSYDALVAYLREQDKWQDEAQR